MDGMACLMKFSYLLCPIMAWLVAGILKFLINCIQSKGFAFDKIGYGGLPSTHTAIVSSTTTLIALREGIHSGLCGLALTVLIITIIDAMGLRIHMGKHARMINELTKDVFSRTLLREQMGHQLHEILAGIIVGILVALSLYSQQVPP